MSWVRRLLAPEIKAPEVAELACEGTDAPLRIPADALRSVLAALMPVVARYGSVRLDIGASRIASSGPVLMTTTTEIRASATPAGRGDWIQAHRDETEAVPGSGRAVAPRQIPLSLSLRSGRTFACPHFSIGSATSVSCEQCGPLEAFVTGEVA